MKSFGSRTAPGPDGFKPIILKNLNEKAVIFLTSLYKISISTQQIPSSWRKMDVIFIIYSYIQGANNQGSPKRNDFVVH